MGTNTYQRVAVKVDNLTVMGLDQLRAILRRNKQMFGKLGEMFLESGRSYNPQYTVGRQFFSLRQFYLQDNRGLQSFS
jgi:hypothetical protein